MPNEAALTRINDWKTVRFELLNTRLCDLGLKVSGSPLERYLLRLRRELEAKKITRFQPQIYLTNEWGCPDRVPVIGVPFYLADRRLQRLEEEQTGEVEDERTVMMYLRHETGHAINYAYRLWREPEWTELFGPFGKPYHERFRPVTFSRDFVRHLNSHQYGRNYAQKHPDEDFAETFAIWLTPRSGWRQRYRNWPAIEKLQYVDRLMRSLRTVAPKRRGGKLLEPVSELTCLLADHYGQRAERYRASAQNYVDDKLHSVFPELRRRDRRAVEPSELEPAHRLVRTHRDVLVTHAARWSSLSEATVRAIVEKVLDRAANLRLGYRSEDEAEHLLALMSLVTALAMDYAYTGQLSV